MRWADRIREALGSVSAVPELARADRVGSLVPVDATYVTLGRFAVLADARAFVGGTPGQAPYRYTFGRPPTQDEEPGDVGLLVLAGGRLRVIDATGEPWSVEAAQVTD